MKMDTLYKLEDMCCKELDEIVKRGEMSTTSLEKAQLLTDTVKNVHKIEMLTEGDYSQAGEWEAKGSYDRGNSYRGMRYSRDYGGDRSHYNENRMSREGDMVDGYSSRRDSRGRYSRDGGDKQDMMRSMERMMEQTDNPADKDAYRRAMEILRNS